MQYNIKGTDVPISDELRSYAEKCLAHAEKFLSGDSVAHADVELEHAPVRDGAKYRAEFTVVSSTGLYRAEAWGTTLHEALDLASDELNKELRRDKSKRIDVFRRSALKVKEYLRGWRRKV
jgi:putative sigma-54 modulation protein